MLFNVRGFEPVGKRLTCPSVFPSPDFWLWPWAMERGKRFHTEVTEVGHREQGDVFETPSVHSVP